jgi:hypothetical protein
MSAIQETYRILWKLGEGISLAYLQGPANCPYIQPEKSISSLSI